MKKQIVFFGDSLTAGYGLKHPSIESFPALISAMLNQAKTQHELTNAGISGDTTSSALLRLPGIIGIPADIFVLALGANDMLRGYPPSLLSTNLEKIISAVQEAHPNAKILLLGMELPAWITAQRATQYRDIYSSLAKRHHLALLPFLLEGVIGSPTLNIADGVHPNAEGYQIIAKRVWPLLKSLL